MGRTQDFGSRIELVPMDLHFHEVSLGLYRQETDFGPEYLIHSYSSIEGIDERVTFVRKAAQILGDMVANDDGLLSFSCHSAHSAGTRRIFLESCKIPYSNQPELRSLTIFDKKAGCEIHLSSLGDGTYEVDAEEVHAAAQRRAEVVARGLCKLGEMDPVTEDFKRIAFPCGHAHDALVGLLLVRAPNVRAAMREEETAAARGMLAAPSQQK